ncbi:SHOCT domain-containing protein [Massilibacterium senegalense]|uniref:SHOCT domain-containing protein n=1 Tax=Massilibacterium senegalense TaxID=1632858 RepID=UPI0007859661|nr:SHOCT domain-containing protein [Massilibacterium senegalense]
MRVKQFSQNNPDEMENKYEMSHEQLQNEFDYYRAEGTFVKFLENNLITKEEFNKIVENLSL